MVGGTGFLGQHIVAELARRGHEPVVLARNDAAGRAVVKGDALTMPVEQWAQHLAGCEAVVFAAGADASRAVPAPATAFFERGNVEPVRRMMTAARATGCRGAVICGSYFSTIAREHPELHLAASHPYVHSRLEQARAALDAAGPELSVAVLEIPYVLGAAEGRPSALSPLVPWLRSRWPLFAPPGGTAVATATQVAQGACGALERAASGNFPIAEANLTWTELFARLAETAGRAAPVQVRTLPAGLLRGLLQTTGLLGRARRRETGLDPSRLTDLLTREAYLDPQTCRTELGVVAGGLDEAMRDTVQAAGGVKHAGAGQKRGGSPPE